MNSNDRTKNESKETIQRYAKDLIILLRKRRRIDYCIDTTFDALIAELAGLDRMPSEKELSYHFDQ